MLILALGGEVSNRNGSRVRFLLKGGIARFHRPHPSPEIGLFRGKFLGLSGYCDFVANSAKRLMEEGEISLEEYLADCKASGIEPYEHEEKIKTFTLRYPESFGDRLAIAAAEQRMSVNVLLSKCSVSR